MVMSVNSNEFHRKRCCTQVAVFLSAPLCSAVIFLLLVTGFMSTVSLAVDFQQTPNTIHQHTLLPGLQCSLTTDGNLVLSLHDSHKASSVVVLEGGVVPPSHSRRPNPQTVRQPFYACVSQGAEAGRRGFSAQADDDGDGLVDEDLLDGRDNDHDGKVDEDFAAIADAMVVVDQHNGQQGSHLEFYHWSYPQLQSAVFINISVQNAIDEPMSGWWRFNLPETQWREVEVNSTRHGKSGRQESTTTSAFVAEMPGVLDSGSLWLGTLVLDQSAINYAGKLGQRVRLERGSLDIPTTEGSLPVVICAAESWLQLSRTLSEARLVFMGTTDPMSGLQVPWIVSPGCTICRVANAPEAEWEELDKNGMRLNFIVEPGMNVYFDPDMFTVHGIHLGAPEGISWSANELPFSYRVWQQATLAKVCLDPTSFNNPYESFSDLDGHLAAGTLSFEFPVLPEKILSKLTQQDGELPIRAAYLDGRQAHFLAGKMKGPVIQEPAVATPEDPDLNTRELLTVDQLSLSADLLNGFPNPFKEDITIRFSIPQSMENAFELPEGDDWPADWDKSAPVPWDGGSPSVSVKIYNINGRELRTLHEGNHFSGEFTVGWDGSDAFGRKVASGTYFCKLQLDKWSVTRRVIFLR